jgi:hypothetical protein
MKSVVDRDPAPGEGGTGLESPIGRAIWASSALPSMFPDRYSFGTDAPLGNEDVFEDTRTPYYKGMQEHFKKRLSPFPEAWKQITNPEILNPKLKGGGIKIEDIKPEAFEDEDEDLGEDADWINELHNQLTDPDAEFNKKWTLTSFNRHSDSESKKPKASKKGLSSKAASFGAMMGKIAAGETWTAPNAGDFLPKGNQPAQQPRYTADNLPRPAPIDGKAYSYRENDMYKTRQDMHRKADAVRAAAGAYGPGTATGTMRQGVVQPGATFTPQGQQPSSNNIDWSSVTTQGGAKGSPQAAPSTAMQRWKNQVSEYHKAQALKDKGTDREIQSSSWTSPNAASFLPKPVIESKTPKRLP